MLAVIYSFRNCDKGVGGAERGPGKCVSKAGNFVSQAQKKRVISLHGTKLPVGKILIVSYLEVVSMRALSADLKRLK